MCRGNADLDGTPQDNCTEGEYFIMTSQERREARYQRRKAKRQARREARCAALGPINKVFSYRKMFFYGRRCCNGVRWKQSTQNFELHLFSGTARRRREVLEGRWKPRKCTHFTLRERGKVRPIDAPHITDRQIHKTLCNEVLVPLYTPSMIHDNEDSPGASRTSCTGTFAGGAGRALLG